MKSRLDDNIEEFIGVSFLIKIPSQIVVDMGESFFRTFFWGLPKKDILNYWT